MKKSPPKTLNSKLVSTRQDGLETRNLRIALVYDKVNTWGGAERVLLALHEIFPDAPLYTSVHHPKNTAWAKVFSQIIPSFLQNFPFATTHSHWYSILMPLAFESLNFDRFNIVISITSGEAKSIITKPHTLHLCYCLTPTRYLWVDPGYNSYQHFGLLNSLIHSIKAPFLHYLRAWDQIASHRPDAYATISQTVQQRISKYYRRDSHIIHPPVNTNFFQPPNYQLPAISYYLVVSRLVPYKKVDLVIETFNLLKLPLKIVGNGPQLSELQALAKSNIQFISNADDSQLKTYYQNCQALIMPQIEDFGITALEAQACGKPIIAYRSGGATETIIENKTGLFFDEQTSTSLVEAIQQFNPQQFDSLSCRQNALKFSLDNFQTQMKQWVADSIAFFYYRL